MGHGLVQWPLGHCCEMSAQGGRLTPRIFTDTEGVPFPATVLDDRSGVEAGRRGFYALAPENARVKRLPAKTFEAVQSHAAAGERALSAGDFPVAWRQFVDALQLLPEPTERWNAAGWLLVAMGETQFRGGHYEKAVGPFQDSIICPGTLGNPWVHLRLGQVRFELGAIDRAADELARAYMGGGRDAFEGQDPKYFALVEKVLRPPTGMDRLP
jgi:tetratricopeptide (TPR) repeat protein